MLPMKIWVAIIATAVVAGAIGFGVGVAVSGSDDDTTRAGASSNVTDNTSSGGEEPVDEPTPVTLTPADFKFGVKVREKTCFGSAGCNITYQINPEYIGAEDATMGSWDITYRVVGGTDGPQLNTMTLEDGTFSFDEEELIDTPRSSTVLRAQIVRVEPNG